MIVRQFLHWLRTAPSGDRAEATSALARAFLYSDLTENDRAAAEGAMIMLLDDPSPLVRRALAEVFAGCENAPPTVVHALASDQPDVAAPILQRSPLLLDSDLVEAVATGEPERQIAIASALESAVLGVGGDRRGRLRGGLPDAAGKPGRRNRAVLARPDRAALRPSGRHSRRAARARTICRRRRARRWWSSFRRRWPISSPRANGWPRIAPAASPARPARRRPSRLPPSRRRARCAR